jgi:hypothetical protein
MNMADVVTIVLEDIPALIKLGLDVKADVAKLVAIPKAQRKALDYALCFGADPNGIQAEIAKLIDTVEAQLAAPPAP